MSPASATSSAGSPARRGASSTGTLSPVTSSTVRITSRTLYPRPVPTLYRSADPGFSAPSASTCAAAKSSTWT